MTHAYNLTGMTCGNCEAKVKSNLLMVPDITSVEVSKDTNTATITMDKHIALSDLQKAFGGGQALYYDYFPMYNKGKDGYWISEVKDIKNPYLGKAMPTCGSVKEELK